MLKVLLTAALLVASAAAQPTSSKLQIYFIDVEGGQSTLFVTPTGQSLLIDTGWPGNGNRDADRIAAAAHQAGLSRIDYVLITHFHADHVGGVPQLVARIPVGTFIDHGPNRELTPDVSALDAAYRSTLTSSTAKHLVLKPGDHLPVTGIDATVISADGKLIANPLPGAGQPNSFCPAQPPAADNTENLRSLGTFIRFGKLRILDLGDLTRDKEYQLMCPVNKLGAVDILVVSHHGWEQSSSPALIDAIHPRVAIMDNGATKGGSTPVLDTIRQSPGLEALWQLHYSEEGGPQHNTPVSFIANPQGPDAGNYLKLVSAPDGTFTVTNPRTSVSVDYPAR